MSSLRAGVSIAVALLAGAAQAVSIAAFWNGQAQWWLQLLSLAALAGVLRTATPWRAFACGWAFSIAWLTGTFWWLFISMHRYGGLPAPVAGAAVLALAAFLGTYYAAAAGVFARLRRGNGWDVPLFAGVWLAAELMRATWFTGFPWGAGGYAHVEGPLAGLAPVVGVYGIGWCAAAIAAALAMGVARGSVRSWRAWAAALAAMGLLAACQFVSQREGTASTARGMRVALLQGNIPQDEKFEGGSGIPLALDWYGEQIRNAQAALVVAPETAIPLLPAQLPEGYLGSLGRPLAEQGRAAMIGIPLGDSTEGYSNSVLGLHPDRHVYRYDKHHLVPFGEFIPPLFRWFTQMMNIPLGDFNRGAVGQASFAWQGERLAPNICYEDLFGEELGARFADAATAPTVFVNVSNIAWFGDTIAIDQHLQISRMRTLEFRRPMLRATNTGATAIIDAQGRVTHALPRHTRGVLVGEVRGGTGVTPFAWWVSRLALWPLWLLALALPLCLAVRLPLPWGRGQG